MAAAEPVAGSAQPIIAALIGIAVIALLITQLKPHPFLSLTIGSFVVAVVAGENLADSGGADEIVDTIVSRSSDCTLPWAMALVGGADRPADVLRDRSRAADAGDHAGVPAVRAVADRDRHPDPWLACR